MSDDAALRERALLALGVLSPRDSVTAWNASHPTHPKDTEGKWADTSPGGDGGKNPLDKLGLAKRAPAGFIVRSSKKLKTDYADVGIAEVDGPDGSHFRVGVIGTESGKWDAGFTGEARKTHLRQEIARKQALMDSDDDGVDDDIEDQISELESELEDLDNERTAVVSPEAMVDFRRQLGEALTVAKENKTKQDATTQALDALDEKKERLVAEFSDPDLEEKISDESGRLRSRQKTIKSLENGPDTFGYGPELTAELIEGHKAAAKKHEANLTPLLARRAELVPPDVLAQLEDLDRQYRALTEDDIDDMLTSAEVSAPNGARVVAEIWGSDDEDEQWVSTRLYVLAPDETTDGADQSDGYGSFRGLKGLNKLIAGLDTSGSPEGGGVSRAQLREVVAAEVEALLRSDVDDDPIGELDDDTLVLLQAMAELDEEAGVEGRAWNPSEHKRWPKGHPLGGKFRPMVELLKMAIANHDGNGHPFEHFKREQLYKAAKARGITLKHGESKDSIADKLLADLESPPAKPKTKPPQDNLDQLSDVDLKDLAAEYGVETLGRSREDIIADLRPKIAAGKAKATGKPNPLDEISPLTGKPVSESAWAKKALETVAPSGKPGKAAPKSNIPGVKLTKINQVFGAAPDAYDVDFNGVNVGTIHGNEADPAFGWVPFTKTNSPWNLNDPGGKASKDDAVKELVDSFEAAPESIKEGAIKAAGLVTTKPFPDGPFPGHKESLLVEIGGEHVGAIHKDADGKWTAAVSGGKLPGFTTPPKGATKEQALQAFADAKSKAPMAGGNKVAATKSEAVPAAIQSGDFSGLRRVGESAGTTPGGLFEAPDGSRWYVKAQKTPKQAQNEALASAFYRAAGIDAPAVMQGKGTPGLPGESHTATRWVDGAQANLAQKIGHDDAYINKIRKGFAVDAWLANWDVVGEGSEHPWGNIVEDADGEPQRIDVGGALLFRGAGGEKGDKFGPQVVEFDTMRKPEKGRRHALIFADMSGTQLANSVGLVKAITPAKIRKLVADHGMGPDLADLLIARRKDLISRVSATKNVSKGWKGAAIGEAVLDSAPVKITSSNSGTRTRLEQLGLEADTAHWATLGFQEYQDGKYGDMNRALLNAAGGDLRTVGYLGLNDDDITMVESMDRAMKVSKLTKDVIVYRGERAPARSFPPGTWSLTGGMEGMEWTWHPFGSSSTDSDVAELFAVGATTAPKDQAQPTVFRILVRKGTPAVHLQGTMENEQELLLGRSLKYRVVKDYGVEDGLIRRIDVEVVPA